MNYKNEISCPNCGEYNFDYEIKCKNCKSFIRERIVNLDLGETLIRLIDSPTEAFHRIKFSEHKNYLIVLLIFLSIRFLIISRFISVPFTENSTNLSVLILWVISFIITISLLTIVSFVLQKIFLVNKVNARFKDILSVVVYSFVPNVFALIILFPIELVFYGEFIFANNPYPYQIKESIFYFLLTLEALTIIWSVFLMTIGLKEFLRARIFSFVITIIVWILISVVLFLQSKIFLIK